MWEDEGEWKEEANKYLCGGEGTCEKDGGGSNVCGGEGTCEKDGGDQMCVVGRVM